MPLCVQNSNADSDQAARTGSGGVKAEHTQSQPEATPFSGLVPTDATVNNTAALAALAAAQAAAGGPDAAEFWRQRAGQLAGSGVDLTQLAASAAGQAHVVQVRDPLLPRPVVPVFTCAWHLGAAAAGMTSCIPETWRPLRIHMFMHVSHRHALRPGRHEGHNVRAAL